MIWGAGRGTNTSRTIGIFIPFPIISFTLCHSELRYESVFLSGYFAALNMTKCKANCGKWY